MLVVYSILQSYYCTLLCIYYLVYTRHIHTYDLHVLLYICRHIALHFQDLRHGVLQSTSTVVAYLVFSVLGYVVLCDALGRTQ